MCKIAEEIVNCEKIEAAKRMQEREKLTKEKFRRIWTCHYTQQKRWRTIYSQYN